MSDLSTVMTTQGCVSPEPQVKEKDVAIKTEEVGVTYGSKKALEGVNLTFRHGEVTALIGPSGCGKSTFLRCLNLMNLEIPNCRIQGRIVYHGADINARGVDLFKLRSQIGMVFQQPNPFHKSIYENVAFALRHHGVSDRKVIDETVTKSLQAAAIYDEVKDKLDGSAYALSGGQRQRLCIARTLALAPDVVLMDEPCSALDPIATLAIEQTITQMARQGICVIIVTHNIEQARRISDRTAFFLLGKVVESGETDHLFMEPQDKRTEDYISGRFG